MSEPLIERLRDFALHFKDEARELLQDAATKIEGLNERLRIISIKNKRRRKALRQYNRSTSLHKDKTIWAHFQAECRVCTHKWVAVIEGTRTGDLECPECGRMSGDRIEEDDLA